MIRVEFAKVSVRSAQFSSKKSRTSDLLKGNMRRVTRRNLPNPSLLISITCVKNREFENVTFSWICLFFFHLK